MSTGLAFLASTDYILVVEYTQLLSTAKLIKLSDNTEQVSGNLAAIRSPTATRNKAISTAQSHMLGVFSNYIHCTASGTDDSVAYFKEIYAGTPGTSSVTGTKYQMVSHEKRV
jgi:hypothetical protein